MRRSCRLRASNFIFLAVRRLCAGLPMSHTTATQLFRHVATPPYSWRVPSRSECMSCHSRQANFVLGLSELQADCSQKYGDVEMNQLHALDKQKVIDPIEGP